MSQFTEGQSVSKRRLALVVMLLTGVLAPTAGAQSSSQSETATTATSQSAQPSPIGTRAAPEAQQSATPTPPPSAAPAAPTVTQVPPDTVVMKVGSQQITAEQFQGLLKSLNPAQQRALAAQGFRPLGENYAMFLAVAQKAEADGLDQTPEFKQKMEMARKQALYLDEYKKLNAGVQVKQDDIDKYYAEHHKDFEQLQIQQISVRKKPEGAKSDAAGLPEDEAKKRAEDIHQALDSGQDATKVAEQYKLANVVFLTPRSIRHGQIPGDLDRQAWTLKDGGVSEIQNNPMNFYFIQVVKHETLPVSQVSKEIEGKLRDEKLRAAVEGVKEQANIWLDQKYFAPPPTPTAPRAANVAPSTSGAQPTAGPVQKPN